LGDQKRVRCTVYLSPEQYLSAGQAGSGSVSEGIRRQLEELASLQRWLRGQVEAAAAVQDRQPRRRHQ
jgi:hypothetical protein